jgi:hypothetical protein
MGGKSIWLIISNKCIATHTHWLFILEIEHKKENKQLVKIELMAARLQLCKCYQIPPTPKCQVHALLWLFLLEYNFPQCRQFDTVLRSDPGAL